MLQLMFLPTLASISSLLHLNHFCLTLGGVKIEVNFENETEEEKREWERMEREANKK